MAYHKNNKKTKKNNLRVDPLGNSIENNDQLDWNPVDKTKHIVKDEYFPNKIYHQSIDYDSDELGGVISFEEWESRYWLDRRHVGMEIEPDPYFHPDRGSDWIVKGPKKKRKLDLDSKV